MLETSYLGVAKLYRYSGSGLDWTWTEVPAAEAEATFSNPGTNFVSFNLSELNGATRLAYQVRTLDQNYNRLNTSYSIPLAVNNTGFVQDLFNNLQ